MAFSGAPLVGVAKSFPIEIYDGITITFPAANDRMNSNRVIPIRWEDENPAHASWQVSYIVDAVETIVATVNTKSYDWTPPSWFKARSVLLKVSAS